MIIMHGYVSLSTKYNSLFEYIVKQADSIHILITLVQILC